MAKAWDKTYNHGNEIDLPLGYNYKKKCRSIRVKAGEKVTFYDKQDRSGKKSVTFYEGDYLSLGFYSVDATEKGVIHVEKCDLRSQDMIQINWYQVYGAGKKDGGKYRKFQKIPIGEHKIGSSFPNDKIEELEIPLGVTVEVFDQDKFEGGSLIFSGQDEKKRSVIKLKDYNYSKKVSSMKITSDDWVLAGLALEDPVQIGDTQQIAGTAELANNSEHSATVTQTLTWTKCESVEENWNIGGRVLAKVEAEITTGIVATTVGGEIEVSGGYGESKATTKETSYENEVSATVDGFGIAHASMLVTLGKTKYKAVRKWRNLVTNAILQEIGELTVSKAVNTRVEIH